MFVHECMSSPAVTIRPDTPFRDALDLMEERGCKRFVVVDDRSKLIGIVTELDLMHALPSSANSLNKWELRYMLSHIQAKEIMTKKVITTTPDATIEGAVSQMVDYRISGLPVVGENNRVVGIITLSNILRTCGPALTGNS